METSKTPKFDALLDTIFETLVPHTRTCKWKGVHQYCEGDFKIEAEDIEFLKMLRVPPPNFCPTCRYIKRHSFLSWIKFFKRPCNAPSHTESIISSVPPNCQFPVVDMEYYTTTFDAFSFGFVPDVSQSVFDQFWKLRTTVPAPAMANRDPSNVNSDYSTGGRDLKNGYYVSGCFRTENAWYSSACNNSRNVMDCRFVDSCDRAYNTVRSEQITTSSYVYFSNSCIDCMFLYDCRNCTDCVSGVNLRNAKYVWFGEQLTKEEYSKRKEVLKIPSRSHLKTLENTFWKMVKTAPFRATRNSMSENVDGVMVRESSDAHKSIDVYRGKHVRHCQTLIVHNDSMDAAISGGSSHHLYETVNVGSQSGYTKFSAQVKFALECEFVLSSKHVEYCFMCIGLESKRYCIFNRPYSVEEYWPLVDSIKFKMLIDGEYGDGLPINYALQAYNASINALAYPLAKEIFEKMGGYYQEEIESNVGSMPTMSASDLPETIAEVSDDILTKAIICQTSGRPFRIIATELAFYRERGIPLPVEHPQVRIDERNKIGDVLKFYPASCYNCKKAIDSIVSENEGFNLYCDQCYIHAVE